MSLPNDNDDDDNGRHPWRDPFGHRDGYSISPTKKLTVASSNDADDRTADETSIGSMSFSSDITSVVGTGTNLIPSTPARQGRTRAGTLDTPMSALSTNTTADNDDNSIQSGVSFNTEDETAIQLRRQWNRRQLQRLGVATGASFSLFLYMLVPTALLLSMILFGSVSSTFLYQLATIMRWEFDRSILEGRGIGDYLPRGIYEMLTSTSLHDFMTDPDGIFGTSEHLPYLMLYMIPGLTSEQLDRYIARLSPTHQRLLQNQQGLMGFLMNRNNHRLANASDGNQDSTLMRFIMGDERLQEWRQQQGSLQHHPSNIAPRRLILPPTIPEEEPPVSMPTIAPTPIRILEDETPPSREDDASESISEPPSAGIPATVATIVGRSIVPNPPPPSVADNSSQPSATRSNPTRQFPERRPSITADLILFDAMGSAVANIVGDATNAVREHARETFRETLSVPIYRATLGVTALGLGVGAFGLANGTYDLQSLTRPIGQLVSTFMGSLLGGSGSGGGTSRGSGGSAPWVRLSLSLPPFGVLIGSTIASGTTAVVLGLFGTSQRRGGGSSRGDNPPRAAAATTTANSKCPSPKP